MTRNNFHFFKRVTSQNWSKTNWIDTAKKKNWNAFWGFIGRSCQLPCNHQAMSEPELEKWVANFWIFQPVLKSESERNYSNKHSKKINNFRADSSRKSAEILKPTKNWVNEFWRNRREIFEFLNPVEYLKQMQTIRMNTIRKSELSSP